MVSKDKFLEKKMLPGDEEFFDAVRRHICQVLGFDYGLIDLVRGHEIVNFLSFLAHSEDDHASRLAATLEDEHHEPLAMAHSLIANQVKESQRPVLARAYAKGGSAQGFPYAVVPILEGVGDGPTSVTGLIRVIFFDESKTIDEKELSTLKLIGEHLSSKLPPAVPGQAAQPSKPTYEAESVLVVHSNRLERRRLSRIISGRYQVFEVDNYEKALETLSGKSVDLIILDSQVKDSTGSSFLGALKEFPQWKHIPVILIACDSGMTGKIEGLNAGADDCLLEACHEAELMARIRASLRLRKTEKDLATQWQLLEDYAQRLEQAFEAERQASFKVSIHNQSLEQLNRELQQSKLKEQVLRGQEQLLYRISDIIRHSFNINENVSKML
ncbi:MAG: response regulator, partial [Candidatus Melainabacteria bacterium]|nr:response regulator [Candidatus Melainabacteria bacterium]